VKIVDKTTGQILREFLAYESSFKGGVRLATGDMDGDGIDEIITAPGRSRASEIRVFTQEGVELTQYRTQAFPSSYKGGTEVAVGDVNGDGRNDIVAVPTEGRVEVRVFLQTGGVDPLPNAPSRQFYVFDKKFKGGADVTLADVGTFSGGAAVDAATPDGLAEIIVASGPGMRATVHVYDVTAAPTVVDTVLPFANSFKGGLTVEAGRVNADAIPDLIFGSGNGGGSAVQIWDGRTDDLVDQALAGFYAFSNTPTKNAPVHVTGMDLNDDGVLDLLAAVQGTNGKSNQIRCFDTAGTPVGLPLGGFTGPWNIATIKSPAPSLFLTPPPAPASPAATDAVFSGYTPPKKKK
jgi:hypothetical protein